MFIGPFVHLSGFRALQAEMGPDFTLFAYRIHVCDPPPYPRYLYGSHGFEGGGEDAILKVFFFICFGFGVKLTFYYGRPQPLESAIN